MTQPFLVPPDTRVSLSDYDPGWTGDYRSKAETKADVKRCGKRLKELQEVLWAEGKHSLLIVLQAMDAGGKDGTSKQVMRGVNIQDCQVPILPDSGQRHPSANARSWSQPELARIPAVSLSMQDRRAVCFAPSIRLDGQ